MVSEETADWVPGTTQQTSGHLLLLLDWIFIEGIDEGLRASQSGVTHL